MKKHSSHCSRCLTALLHLSTSFMKLKKENSFFVWVDCSVSVTNEAFLAACDLSAFSYSYLIDRSALSTVLHSSNLGSR